MLTAAAYLRKIYKKNTSNDIAAGDEKMEMVLNKGKELFSHRIFASLVLCLTVLFVNAGRKPSVDIAAGILLCMAGLTSKQPLKTDLRIFLMLTLYTVFGFASSYVVYGTIAKGYAAVQAVFPIVYLTASYLSDEERVLIRRLSVIFGFLLAFTGLAQFVYISLVHSAIRLGGIIGNPNQLGMLLVICYFAFIRSVECEREKHRYWVGIEPVMLAAIALTLSLGSIIAMEAGMFIILISKIRENGKKTIFMFAVRILAKINIGMGLGILLYAAASKSGMPWLAVPAFIYILIFAVNWKSLNCYLMKSHAVAVIIAVSTVVLGILIVAFRPSAGQTFAERVDMMRDGANYIFVNPLFGIGSYNWRHINTLSGGKIFGTAQIHNAFLHTGVELGIPAMLSLVIATAMNLLKKKNIYSRAADFAFFLHNLVDVVFFNTAITSLLIASNSEPEVKGRYVTQVLAKIIYAAFFSVLCVNLYWYIVN